MIIEIDHDFFCLKLYKDLGEEPYEVIQIDDAVEAWMESKKKCGDCKWLCGNKSTVGIACLHPDRPFQPNSSSVAHYKYKSSRACKRFERREE